MSDKPFESLERLVEILCDERGLEVSDRDAAIFFLHKTNYYRFSGYARNWQIDPLKKINNFRPNSNFEKISRILDLDSQVRSTLFAWCSEVEIIIRSKLAYRLAEAENQAGRDRVDFYLELSNYISNTPALEEKSKALIESIKSNIERKCGKSFMIDNYVTVDPATDVTDFSRLPIWVAVEVMSFGNISNIISLWKDRGPISKVAKSVDVPPGRLTEVVHAVSVLRNACAHHEQLWNRFADKQAPILKAGRTQLRSCHEHSHYVTVWWLKRILEKSKSTLNLQAVDEILDTNELYAERLLNPKFGGTNQHGRHAP